MKTIASLFLCLLGACSWVRADGCSLRVMAYNVKHGHGMDGRVDIARAAQVIRTRSPDLVALQEIDVGVDRSGRVDQPAELGRLTGMHHAFGKFLDYGGGDYGLAILSRFPITEVRRIVLPDGRHEPRSALLVRVDPPGFSLPVDFVCVHLDWLQDDTRRFAQAHELHAALGATPHPVIVAGDFNDRPESRTMRFVFGEYQSVPKPAGGRFTFPADAPVREIDYVVVRSNVPWSGSCRVVDEPLVSDHRPIVAELTFDRSVSTLR
ncbi:MAG: endonuclease/exonuclease/phosphatase family protein [Planctomycetes bacterium]|nr:endonuclease/exonuclease/phosphatase family protein [Planctomycetota bacterium]